MVKNIQPYRALVKYSNHKNLKFHTYQPKQERSYRVVIKNLHHTTSIEEIKNAIEHFDHKVRNITNVKSRITKTPLSMFFVDLEPNPNNKTIYYTRHINNTIVNIVLPKKTKELFQCYRCQNQNLLLETSKLCQMWTRSYYG